MTNSSQIKFIKALIKEDSSGKILDYIRSKMKKSDPGWTDQEKVSLVDMAFDEDPSSFKHLLADPEIQQMLVKETPTNEFGMDYIKKSIVDAYHKSAIYKTYRGTVDTYNFLIGNRIARQKREKENLASLQAEYAPKSEEAPEKEPSIVKEYTKFLQTGNKKVATDPIKKQEKEKESSLVETIAKNSAANSAQMLKMVKSGTKILGIIKNVRAAQILAVTAVLGIAAGLGFLVKKLLKGDAPVKEQDLELGQGAQTALKDIGSDKEVIESGESIAKMAPHLTDKSEYTTSKTDKGTWLNSKFAKLAIVPEIGNDATVFQAKDQQNEKVTPYKAPWDGTVHRIEQHGELLAVILYPDIHARMKDNGVKLIIFNFASFFFKKGADFKQNALLGYTQGKPIVSTGSKVNANQEKAIKESLEADTTADYETEQRKGLGFISFKQDRITPKVAENVGAPVEETQTPVASVLPPDKTIKSEEKLYSTPADKPKPVSTPVTTVINPPETKTRTLRYGLTPIDWNQTVCNRQTIQ